MKTIKFEKDCINFGEDQDEYKTLPVVIAEDENGKIYISCWKLNIWEKIKVLLNGRIYLMILGNQPPVIITTKKEYKLDD